MRSVSLALMGSMAASMLQFFKEEYNSKVKVELRKYKMCGVIGEYGA